MDLIYQIKNPIDSKNSILLIRDNRSNGKILFKNWTIFYNLTITQH